MEKKIKKKKKDLQEGEAKGKLKSYMVKDGERRNIPSARIRQQQFPMLGQEIRQLEKSCNLRRKHFQEMAKLKQKQICKIDE